MNLMKFATAAALVMTLGIAACSQTAQQQRATGGAALGAAGGALVGQAIGGNTESTLIGAGAGALLGAVLATSGGPQPRDRGREMCRYQDRYGRVFTAPCDERDHRRRGY